VGAIARNGSLANDRCYLSPLGGCGLKITKEHFVSRNILERIATKTLRFENAGHFFGGKNLVEIGIDDFSAKVLCDKHNSSLSDLDTSAGLAFSTIEALSEDLVGTATPGGPDDVFHLSSGLDIERWMVKVYCGMVAAKKIRGLSGKVVQRTDLDRLLLEALVGIASLPAPLGLYVHTFVGQTLTSKSLSFGTVQLTDGSGGVGGLMLSLGVMHFVLVTSPKYGQTFRDQNWRRHQTLAWNVKLGRARIGYLFTY
jgi:hypothetical protein